MLRLFRRRPRAADTAPPKPPPAAEIPGTTEKAEPVEEQAKAWIGVDLDGTLAHYGRWRGVDHIGRPVKVMLARVRQWIDEGYTVKIVTARAGLDGGPEAVAEWLQEHGLPALEVTDRKDFNMIELWDDRAVQVLPNSGRVVLRPSVIGRPKAPLLDDEERDVTCVVEEAATPPRQPGGAGGAGQQAG